MRLIHSAPQHFMNPAMRWIGWNLKQFLSRQQHILRDSDHLIQLLRSVKVPSTARLVKFDIKDFSMSGHHDDISLLTSKRFPPAVQTGARDLIDSVIRNQVVTVPGVNKYWRVQVGTGMGLRCSGELSDCTFYKLAEEKFATCSEVQRAFGIIFYCRFKDDGFFIIDTPRAKLLEFWEQFKRKSAYFRICVWQRVNAWSWHAGSHAFQRPGMAGKWSTGFSVAPQKKHDNGDHYCQLQHTHLLCIEHGLEHKPSEFKNVLVTRKRAEELPCNFWSPWKQ